MSGHRQLNCFVVVFNISELTICQAGCWGPMVRKASLTVEGLAEWQDSARGQSLWTWRQEWLLTRKYSHNVEGAVILHDSSPVRITNYLGHLHPSPPPLRHFHLHLSCLAFNMRRWVGTIQGGSVVHKSPLNPQDLCPGPPTVCGTLPSGTPIPLC